MTRAAFLAQLRAGLSGLPQDEIEELVADYDAHFEEGLDEGRSEDEVAAALGSPRRLARELRAEAGLRKWETNRSAGNYAAAVLALIALLALDFVILLPFLFLPLLGIVIAVAVALIAMLIGGIALLTSTLTAGGLLGNVAIASSMTSIGLIAGGIGGGALFILILEFILKLLAKYARLHYRLLDSGAREA